MNPRRREFCAQTHGKSGTKEMLDLLKELRQMSGSPIKDCKRALAKSEGDMEKAWDYLRAQGVATAQKKAGNLAQKGLIVCSSSPCGRSAVLVEVNSETDFCENNAKFQNLVREIGDAVLAAPNIEFPCGEASLTSVELSSSESRAEATNVGTAITDLVASIRENLCPSRATKILVDEGGVVGSYVHGRKAPGLGLKAGLVGLQTNPSVEASPVLSQLGKDLAMHVVANIPQPRFLRREDIPKELVRRERDVIEQQMEQEGKIPEEKRGKVTDKKLERFYADVCLLENVYCLGDDNTTITQLVTNAGKELGTNIDITDFAVYNVGESTPKTE